MKIVTTVLGAAGLALGAAFVVLAGMHGGSGGHGPHGFEGPAVIPHMLDWLVDNAVDGVQASDAQRSRLLAVKNRVVAQVELLEGQHEATHEEFKRQWALDRMDAVQLNALVDARLEELRRVLHTAVDGIVEVHDTLTPEQRRMLTERVEAMHGPH